MISCLSAKTTKADFFSPAPDDHLDVSSLLIPLGSNPAVRKHGCRKTSSPANAACKHNHRYLEPAQNPSTISRAGCCCQHQRRRPLKKTIVNISQHNLPNHRSNSLLMKVSIINTPTVSFVTTVNAAYSAPSNRTIQDNFTSSRALNACKEKHSNSGFKFPSANAVRLTETQDI